MSSLLENLTEITAPVSTDLLYLLSDPAGTPADKKVTLLNLSKGLDHGLITGLTDDDHTQYALLAGRSGGQTLIGGTAANEDITIKGTSHATKTTSYVLLQSDGGLVGVGTATPTGKVHILTAGGTAGSSSALVVESNSSYQGIHLRAPAGVGTFVEFYEASTKKFSFEWDAATTVAGVMETAGGWAVNNIGSSVSYLKLTSAGNLGLGTTTPGGGSTVGTKVHSLANGTAPVGGVANQVSLYSADVAASAELFALDEVGNAPQLSPHPSRLLDLLPVKATGPYAYPWAYAAHNPYIGKRIEVDMAGVVEAVEQLTGKSFTTVTDLPPAERANWDTDQETQRQHRQSEINRTQEQIAELDKQIVAEKDLAKVAEMEKRRDEIKAPPEYRKKRPPAWMVNRGVATAIKEARP